MKIGIWTRDYVLKWWGNALERLGHHVYSNERIEHLPNKIDMFITDNNTWGWLGNPKLPDCFRIMVLNDEPKGTKTMPINERDWNMICSVHWKTKGKYLRLPFAWADYMFKDLHEERSIQVGFVGTLKYDRGEFFNKVKPVILMPEQTINGVWISNELLQYAYNHMMIVLNYASGSDIYVKDHVTERCNCLGTREWEAMGCGCLVLTQPRKYISESFVVGKEILTYTDIDDLNKQIAYYLSHWDEAKKIIEAGQKRLAKEHTYVHRMQILLKEAKKHGLGR